MQSHSTQNTLQDTEHAKTTSNTREKEKRAERTQNQGGIEKSQTAETNYTSSEEDNPVLQV